MTVDELYGRLLDGPISLSLDTNSLWMSQSDLVGLGTWVNRANEVLNPGAEGGPIQLCVSALVHAERTRQLRVWCQKKGRRFSVEEVNRGLASNYLAVLPYEKSDAEGTSAFVFALYPTDAGWSDAKKGKGSKSATVDWLIAGHASARAWVMVTNDRGPEWRGLACVSRDALVEALKRIVEPEQPD